MAEPESNRGIPTPTLKVVILGDLGVGKTCLRSQFVHHVFTNAYKATIGGDYLTTTIDIDNKTQPPGNFLAPDDSASKDFELLPATTKVNLQIWDTAGQERFNLISKAFYRGADVAIFMYDITNYESLLSIRGWFDRFMEHCHVDRPGVIIVGNKSDRSSDRCIDYEEVPDILARNSPMNIGSYVENWATDLLEISCKKLAVVEQVFKRVAEIGLSLGPKQSQNRSIVEFDGIQFVEMTKLPISRCAC